MNETGKPVLYGAEYSVYVKIVQLVLAEKHIDHELVSVDVFSDSGISKDYLERNPFGKIPSFSHAGIDLFETGSIVRYIDETFPDPPLMPKLPERAGAGEPDHFSRRQLCLSIDGLGSLRSHGGRAISGERKNGIQRSAGFGKHYC